MKSTWPKKILWFVAGLFGLLIVAIILVPLLVDVDKYRPQIIEVAEQHINGDLEIGKLSLSLWGAITVEVDGLSLADSKDQPVLAADEVFFDVSFLSLLSGSPAITFRLKEPKINVIKSESGKLNLMTLMKEKPAEPPAESGNAADKSSSPEATSKSQIPSMVANARLGVEMLEASLSYRDLKTNLTTQVDHLNLVAKNLSLSEPMSIEVWADLNTKMGESLTVVGPVRMSGSASPKLQNSQFEEATAELQFTLDDLVIEMPGTFKKSKGIGANGMASLRVTPKMAEISNLTVNLHNAKLTGKGQVTGIGGEMEHSLSLNSNKVDLSAWDSLVAAVKQMEVQGTATLGLTSSGALTDPRYELNANAEKVSFKTPMVKTRPEIQASLKVIPDEVESLKASMTAPGTQVNLAGSLKSFTAPRFQFAVTSPGMDLDQWVEFPKKEAAAPKEDAPPATTNNSGTAASGNAKSDTADYDAMLDPLRKNDIARAARGVVTVSIQNLKAKNVTLTPIDAKLTLSQLSLAVEKMQMGVFGGRVGATAQMALLPKAPTYQFNSSVTALDFKKAIASQFSMFENTVTGKGNFEIKGDGRSFNPDAAMANLNANGSLRVEGGKFATIDVATVAAKVVNEAIDKVAAKIPSLANKKVNPGNTESEYEYIGGTFAIQKGVFSAPNFAAKAKPNQGLDLEGATSVNLINKNLQASWLIIDRYNMTKAKDLSVSQSGVVVNQILMKDGVLKFPIKVGGTLSSPAIDYGAAPTYLAEAALANVGKAVADKAKSEAKKAVQQKVNEIGNKASKPVKKLLKGIGDKLFGN